MKITANIDVVSNIGKKEFEEKYLRPQKAVVIRGLIENEIAGARWTFDYFRQTMGDLPVDVYDNSIKKDGSAFTSADFKMKFKDFLSQIEKDERTDLRMFLFNLFKYNPELKTEFPCPDIFKGVLDHLGYTFFAGKDTSVRLHYDIDMSNVLHTQVQGRKRVILFSPENNEFLYRLPLNTFSLVDIENPDYERYPALKYAEGSECTLEPGDSIFIPSAYWHLMTYLTGGISVAYRKIAYSGRAKVQGFLNLGIYLPIDKIFGALFKGNWQKIKHTVANIQANKAMSHRVNGEFQVVY